MTDQQELIEALEGRLAELEALESAIVPGVGPDDADIMFVGEAPGEQEIRMLQPFVGSSGRLLTSLMGTAGILRSACYITNVVKERPPKNDIKLYIDLSKKNPGVAPRYAKYLSYVEQLKAEIEARNPKVIVAVGAVPLWALCQKKGVTKWRGSILESTLVPGKKVIPIIHPAAALRQYNFTYMILHDLQRVLAESTSPDIVLPKRDLIISPDYATVTSFLHALLQGDGPYACDIEVINNEVSCISFADTPNHCLCIPFVKGRDQYWDLPTEAEIWRLIGQVLETKPIVGQNIGFDSTFLYTKFGIRVKVAEDTMVGQAIICPDLPKGLDFITAFYTREPYFKDEGKKWKNPGMSDEQFWLYNAKDSACCLEALPSILRDVHRMDNDAVYHRHVSLIPPLTFIQYRGIKMDIEGMAKERAQKEAEQVETLERLRVLVQETAEARGLKGYTLNPGSPQQLKDYFYVLKGFRPYTKKGAVTTDEKALKQLAAKGCEEASLVLRYRKASKLVGTYLSMTFDEDNRFRGSINPVGTKSGRFSSSKTILGTGGNMQNQPPLMKRFMQADDGYFFAVLDLEQAENRIVAYFAPDTRMIRAFEEGIDIHTQTASLISRYAFGQHKSVEEISREKGSSTLGNGEQSERDWGKRCNHALNYKMGAGQFSITYEIALREATLLRDAYLDAYPGILDYWAFVESCLKRDRTLTNPFGRRRRFLGRLDEDLFKEGFSHLPQSTVADLINEYGLLHIWRDQKTYRSIALANQEHDSLWLLLPFANGWEQNAEILNRIITNLERPIQWFGREFVIPVGAKVGPTVDGKTVDREGGWITGDTLQRAYEKAKEAQNEKHLDEEDPDMVEDADDEDGGGGEAEGED